MDVILFQTNKFLYVGRLMAISLVQGGSGFPFFAQPMYEYLCGVDPYPSMMSLIVMQHCCYKR